MKDKGHDQLVKKILEKCRVEDGDKFSLADHDPSWIANKDQQLLSEKKLNKKAKKLLEENIEELSDSQELLYATSKRSVLIIFQAIDAAGKDGTIKHVMSGINPQGCQVNSFKSPSSEERAHNYLWRYINKMPELGKIGIFNRSYYEEVLVLKVHPGLLESSPIGYEASESLWNERYEDINNLEKNHSRNGTVIIKFFLNVSKEEQKNRFLERLNNPDKYWKFSDKDLGERSKWDSYQNAFEDAIKATASKDAPWYVVPADNKWIMRSIVSTIITETIKSLDLKIPEVTEDQKKVIDISREKLENE